MKYTFAEWQAAAEAYAARTQPHQRRGQALFNFLSLTRERLTPCIVGTPSDPFYDDDHVPAFYNAVEQAWR